METAEEWDGLRHRDSLAPRVEDPTGRREDARLAMGRSVATGKTGALLTFRLIKMMVVLGSGELACFFRRSTVPSEGDACGKFGGWLPKGRDGWVGGGQVIRYSWSRREKEIRHATTKSNSGSWVLSSIGRKTGGH